MITTKDISWIAGLLEGEGCFSLGSEGHNPKIQLMMTDVDVVVHAAQIMNAHKVLECSKPTKSGKPIYRFVVYGKQAISWMMTIYCLMGKRRQEMIQKCLLQWKDKPYKGYPERRSYSRGAKIIWARLAG